MPNLPMGAGCPSLSQTRLVVLSECMFYDQKKVRSLFGGSGAPILAARSVVFEAASRVNM